MRAVPLLLAVLLAGCSARAPVASPPTPRPTAVLPSVRPTPAALPAHRVDKVLVVVLENHSQGEALAQMPYVSALASRYGRTSAAHAVAHPSLPNYLALAGGSTFGVGDDAGPADHPLRGASAFGRARSARVYAEAMPRPCALSGSGSYAVKHNPWPYFVDERAACRRDDLPLSALPADIRAGTLPAVGMLVPDLCHDAHDCPLRTADGWLATWIGRLQSGPDYRSGRLALVVTFDEDDRSAGNSILTVVVHPRLWHVVVRAAVTHLNVNRWLTDVAGAGPLRSAAAVRSLGSLFGL